MLINIIKIVLIIVFIIEISGIVQTIKKTIHQILNGKRVNYIPFSIKPFDCSLCLSFWIILIYSLFNEVNIIQSLFLACSASFLSIILTKILNTILHNFNKLIDKLND